MGKDMKRWFQAAGIRALKTFCQSAVAMIPAAKAISQVDWITVLGTAGLAAAIPVLTSVAGLPELDDKGE